MKQTRNYRGESQYKKEDNTQVSLHKLKAVRIQLQSTSFMTKDHQLHHDGSPAHQTRCTGGGVERGGGGGGEEEILVKRKGR